MSNRETVWTNKDGLRVGFGTRAVNTTSPAATSASGTKQQIVVKIVGTDLLDVDVAKQLAYGVVIPTGSLIESAKLFVTTAFAGATAVMDIGLYNAVTGAEIDDDGIDAGILLTALDSATADAAIACDGAYVNGALKLAAPAKVGITYDTAAYTAGVATLVIEYIHSAN